jgi:hypothetical protein
LHAQGFEIGGVNYRKGVVSLLVEETDLKRIPRLSVVSKRRVNARPDADYKTPAAIESFLAATAANFPELATVETIGKSVQGANIDAIHLTSSTVPPPAGGKKAILFDCMHHAREVMTTEVCYDIIDYLTRNYATDTRTQTWLNRYDVWVVPVVNPDGTNTVFTSDNMWRKNMEGGYGVDLNRNYPYQWNYCEGSSSDTSAEDYRGPSAASEPETQALMSLVTKIHPKMGMSYHSYSELVMYPYGCRPETIPSADSALYQSVGQQLGAKLVTDDGSGTYQVGTPYELLYNADGNSMDWMYMTEGTMEFSVEVNGTDAGFQPPYAQWRDKTVQGQRAGWQFLLDSMSGPGLSQNYSLDILSAF